jgi:hypothetical protein
MKVFTGMSGGPRFREEAPVLDERAAERLPRLEGDCDVEDARALLLDQPEGLRKRWGVYPLEAIGEWLVLAFLLLTDQRKLQ